MWHQPSTRGQEIDSHERTEQAMGQLTLQVQMSLDGFIAGPNGETDWLVWDWGDEWNWDHELKDDFDRVIDATDCILLSRKLAEGGFITHWEQAAERPDDSRHAYASKVNNKPKVVFTTTLAESPWSNTEIASGDVADEIPKLKARYDKGLIVYGGATFLSSLIRARVVDEFQLFINPTALGKGMTIFGETYSNTDLALVQSKAYACGIVVNRYVLDFDRHRRQDSHGARRPALRLDRRPQLRDPKLLDLP